VDHIPCAFAGASPLDVHTPGSFDESLGFLSEPSNILLPVDDASVLGGRHARVTSEGHDEMAEAVEPRPVTYLSNRERQVSKQVRPVLDAQPDQIAVRRQAVLRLEGAGQVEREREFARATAGMSMSRARLSSRKVLISSSRCFTWRLWVTPSPSAPSTSPPLYGFVRTPKRRRVCGFLPFVPERPIEQRPLAS